MFPFDLIVNKHFVHTIYSILYFVILTEDDRSFCRNMFLKFLKISKCQFYFPLKFHVIHLKLEGGEIVIIVALYGSANDPRTANDPGSQMIPKLDRK